MTKIAFVFPGQGAQSVGMGRQLDAELPTVRAMFDQAGKSSGFDLRNLCFEGPVDVLNATDVSQPALFVASLAALESLKTSKPDVVSECHGAAGLSLGEYTALVFAGAIEFEAGLKLVRLRGQAMQAAAMSAKSGMASVLGLDENQVDELCRRIEPFGRLWKANLLGPGNIVVSGDLPALEHVESVAAELGAMKVIRLAVAGALSLRPSLKPADQQLAEFPRPDFDPAAAHSCVFQRRCGPARQAGRHPRHSRISGARGGPVGSLDAPDDGRRFRHVL